ncbi:TonB-dependent siderophore receptor [Gallaecimonas pentaromativorans]|uniref:TonB-dependent siderophore receptor n=1 Tax=Gallaecimonas pentaromativorans TaxID=584787 RepID=UPI003A8DE553
MNPSPTFKMLPLAAVIAGLLSPQAIAEQEADKNADVEKITVTGNYTVSEVIDTATGLGLTLRETPQSVTVITKDRIRDQNLNTVLDTVLNATGLSAQQYDNVRNSFQARGFEITNYQIDGVPLSWSLAGDAGETMADVSLYERVEFVRGATGLLTGAGDPSASINLVRKHADSTNLTGYLDVAAGRWDTKRITADVANKLNASGSVRGRLVAKVVDGDSYWDNYQDRKQVLYGVVDTDLSADTLLRLGASYQHSDPKGATWGALPAFFADGTPTHWSRSKTTATGWNRWETTNKNYFANLNHSFGNGWQLVANYNRMEYTSKTKLLYVSGLLDQNTGAGLGAQRYRSEGESNQDSFDLQLKGDYSLFSRQHEFVLGGLYSSQDATADTFDPIGGDMSGGYDSVPVPNFYQWGSLAEPQWQSQGVRAQDLQTRQKGLFAATRLSVTDSFKLIAGGRVSSWKRSGISYGTVTDFGDDGEFIPYAGALYDLTKQHRLYASYTEIFNPQNVKDASGQYLDPVTGKSYELGLKSTFLNDRLHTSLALFKTDQDNLATLDPTFEGNAQQSSAYYGAKGTESKGFEVEVVGQPVEGWNLSAGYSQFHAEDASGAKVATTSPRKQLKLFTTYRFVDALPALTVGGGVNWQSESYSQGTDLRLEQGAYALVNLMARYELADNLSLQLNVDNLFDKTYYNYMTASTPAYSFYRYGKPRDVTLGVSYHF